MESVIYIDPNCHPDLCWLIIDCMPWLYDDDEDKYIVTDDDLDMLASLIESTLK